MEKRIFISHKETDSKVASALVDALLESLDLQNDEVLCTSCPGHQLKFKPPIVEQIRSGMDSSQVVFALLTPESIKAQWVVFELGAAWVGSKLLIPILAPGLQPKDLPAAIPSNTCIMIDQGDPLIRLSDAVTEIAEHLPAEEKKAGGKRHARWSAFVEAYKQWIPQIVSDVDQNVSYIDSDSDYIAMIEDWLRSLNKQGTVLIRFATVDKELGLPPGTAGKFTSAAALNLGHKTTKLGTGTLTIEIKTSSGVAVGKMLPSDYTPR